jgi:glycerate dehydrogenase
VSIRIVVLDGQTLNPGDLSWDEIAALGSLEVHERSAQVEIVPRARDAEIVLTNKTHLDAATLAELPKLRFIAVLATGYDVVDVAAARQRGIPVSNVPEYSTDSVAQHTIALLLELANAVGEHDRAVHEGEWEGSIDFCFWHRSPLELAGKNLGIIGFGLIGRRVGAIASALGMNVLAAGRSRKGPPSDVVPYPFGWCSLDELLAEAHAVTLHCPLTDENRRLVNADFLGRMRRDAFLINTSRGGLVDEAALAQALSEGRIAGAALDVVSQEPIAADNPLLQAPRCVLTPHLAWASREARARLLATAAENVRAFLRGSPANVVNARA